VAIASVAPAVPTPLHYDMNYFMTIFNSPELVAMNEKEKKNKQTN